MMCSLNFCLARNGDGGFLARSDSPDRLDQSHLGWLRAWFGSESQLLFFSCATRMNVLFEVCEISSEDSGSGL
jgi:hypothetical protein